MVLILLIPLQSNKKSNTDLHQLHYWALERQLSKVAFHNDTWKWHEKLLIIVIFIMSSYVSLEPDYRVNRAG